MSAEKYIELDSTFRNRVLWSNPAQFELLISQSGIKNSTTALDPVSDASPIAVWTSNRFDVGGDQVITGKLYPNDIAGRIFETNSPSTFIVDFNTEPQAIENYYVGAVITLTKDIATDITEKRRISAYKYLLTDPQTDY